MKSCQELEVHLPPLFFRVYAPDRRISNTIIGLIASGKIQNTGLRESVIAEASARFGS